MNAKDTFPVTDEQADDIEELRKTFEDNADLRAALEDYFHIYDDFAEMSEDEFNESFEKYVDSNEGEDMKKEEVKSSAIGDIKDQFALGQIKEEEVIDKLAKQGKGKREAKKILEKWKENGIIKSSADSVADEIADYFGTEVGEDNVIECDDIITHKDVADIQSLIEDDDDVKVKIGMYSVTVEDAPEIKSSTNVYINDDDVTVEDDTDNVIETEEPEEHHPSGTSFVQINSEEDYEEYNVHLPEEYDFEDVKGMWWEIEGDDGVSMLEVIQQTNDGEVFIVIDDDRVFFDTAWNYILDSSYELEDYDLNDEDFEDGNYICE